MWRTHVMGGLSALWLMQPLPAAISSGSGMNNLGLLAICAGLGALLPDLDARESQIKHLTVGLGIAPFFLPSMFLHRALGHRGLLHSLAGWGLAAFVIGLPLYLYLGWQPALALLLGYLSHIALDACTRTGVPFLWPKRKRRYLLPPYLRVTTGSLAEEVVLVPLILAALTLLLVTLVKAAPSGTGF